MDSITKPFLPANEDNYVTAGDYFLGNIVLGYRFKGPAIPFLFLIQRFFLLKQVIHNGL
jgi:hypothetical protein